ncbi:hypothetical protein Ciccas_001196 [Cichlidogyrus casuarinus]|uniref:Uncharacterized protein n=1 Tax=Cichlidogyrus casuarinus TaxID=1844966 RepID=A0ABD2QKR0_9PLAT
MLNHRHQHVEELSSAVPNCIKFLTWSSHELEGLGTPLLPPDEGLKVAENLGWPAITSHLVINSLIEAKTLMEKIRTWYGVEGCVVYFLDSHNKTIGLLKHKTLWYILLRAIRQKARSAVQNRISRPDRFSISNRVAQVEKRIKELSSWLPMDEECVIEWIKISTLFMRYVSCEKEKEIENNDMQNLFPVIWSRFLADKGISDKGTILCTNENPPEQFIFKP